jgi:beta-amyrin synthase
MPPEIVGEKMEPQKLFDSVNILLSLQVRISCIQMVTFVYLKLIIIPLYFLGFAPF